MIYIESDYTKGVICTTTKPINEDQAVDLIHAINCFGFLIRKGWRVNASRFADMMLEYSDHPKTRYLAASIKSLEAL